MNTDKEEIYIDCIDLGSNEYTIQDIEKEISERYGKIDFHYKISAVLEYYGYDPDAVLRINVYRYETDEEVEERIEKQNAKIKADNDAKQKRESAKVAKQVKELEAFNKLLADPEYQKFLELQDKFSKSK